MTRPALILDRDGTVIEERHYLSDPDGVVLLPGAGEALREARRLGLDLFLVTNQSGVGRGYFSLDRLGEIHQRLTELLAAEGVELDGIYFCPHTPDDDCPCRKPRPGMIEQAAAENGFDPRRAFVVGDKLCDVDLGRAVGATTFLVRTGYGAKEAEDPRVRPDHVVDDLRGVVVTIASRLSSVPGETGG